MKRKAQTNPADLAELKRFYCDEGWSLRAIAAKFDVTYQAVHVRLKNAGIRRRRRHPIKQKPINKRILKRLYLDEGLSVSEIGRHLKCTDYYVRVSMRHHGIPRLTLAKRSELGRLSIGETVELLKPKRQKYYSSIYGRAKHSGIRVSIRTIDERCIEVKRVA